MGDELETTRIEEVSSETLPLDKTLNSKCHNNVETKNKGGQKNKRQDSPKKKDKGSRKRKYSSSLDGSDSDTDKDSSENFIRIIRMSLIKAFYQVFRKNRINGNLANNWKSGLKLHF